MTPFDARILRQTSMNLAREGDRLTAAFEIALAERAPTLHATLSRLRFEERRTFAQVVVGAIADLGTNVADSADLAALRRCRRAYRWEPRHDAIVGQALITALAEILGPAFGEDGRNAWTNGYVSLAETLVAATSNRVDLVA
ncbi:hypothetical protein [Lichenifustis flavocetrariae]|uniref:Globin family profile domain-containing protein n=1 Tax=Lichenifustis flavocetrariae TaxID=2949735 RepID=A0AA41YVG7_9HYPH|nr:hypothetical protein [Lichenifustis flavocetrariae]MCW6507663.1 hypothetical protein [Lichenifustis flavocetrariae]